MFVTTSRPPEIQLTDPYELHEYLRSIIRNTSDLSEKFLLLQTTMSLDVYQEHEVNIIEQFKKVKNIFPILYKEYHFLLQYLTERLLTVMEKMIFCPYLVRKGSFELYKLIMVLRKNLSSINKRWLARETKNNDFFDNKNLLFENIQKNLFTEEDTLIKQMHVRLFINHITTQLDQFCKLTVTDNQPYVKRRALELNLLSKLQVFYHVFPVMLKENHFLLSYLIEKLQKLIIHILSCENFRLRTSNEILQALAFLNSIITFK